MAHTGKEESLKVKTFNLTSDKVKSLPVENKKTSKHCKVLPRLANIACSEAQLKATYDIKLTDLKDKQH